MQWTHLNIIFGFFLNFKLQRVKYLIWKNYVQVGQFNRYPQKIREGICKNVAENSKTKSESDHQYIRSSSNWSPVLKFWRWPWDWHEQNFSPRSIKVKKVPVAAGWREKFQGSFVVPCNIRPRSKSCSTLSWRTTWKKREGFEDTKNNSNT